jgi:hypothetical protein
MPEATQRVLQLTTMMCLCNGYKEPGRNEYLNGLCSQHGNIDATALQSAVTGCAVTQIGQHAGSHLLSSAGRPCVYL